MNKDVVMGIYAKPATYLKQECSKAMNQTLTEFDARQKELIGKVRVSAQAASSKYSFFAFTFFFAVMLSMGCM